MAKKILPIVYLDMDNTLADFDRSPELYDWDGKSRPYAMWNVGFFANLKPMKGVLKEVYRLMDSGEYDVRILTQPLALNPQSYTEKASWINTYLSQLINKITMTQDKTEIRGTNDAGDVSYLIDDNSEWKKGFQGEFILFDYKNSANSMKKIVDYLLDLSIKKNELKRKGEENNNG